LIITIFDCLCNALLIDVCPFVLFLLAIVLSGFWLPLWYLLCKQSVVDQLDQNNVLNNHSEASHSSTCSLNLISTFLLVQTLQ
jgi:hypothetical protein